MAKATNFPVSSSPFVQEDTRVLTKEARYLLQYLWLTNGGGTPITGYGTNTTAVNKGPLAPWPPAGPPPTLAQTAAQVTVLTDMIGTLINQLKNYGTISN